jgi:plastocyanin
MRKPLAIAVALAASAVLIVPAGASTPDKKKPVKLEGEVTNKGTGKAKNGEVEMAADDFYFEKTFIKATKGETVTVTLENEGDVDHSFTIDSQDIDETVKPDDTITIEVEVPANGKPVAGYCKFHKESGMQFAFFSRSGKRGGSGGSTDDSTGSSGGYGY